MECVGMSGYFQQLEQRLDCPNGTRKRFLTKTRQAAEEFLRQKPDATRQELIDLLGDPEELAQGFLETLEPEVLERYRKRKKFLLRGCVAALVVVLVAMTCWAVNLRNEPNLVEITGVITIQIGRAHV